jgi:hypothetical protein
MSYINITTPALPFTFTQIAAGNVVVRPNPGMLCTVLVTTTLTAAQNITFFDNTSAQGAVGTIVGIVLGGATAGTVIVFNMPCVNGILIQQNAALAAGAITVSIGN